MNSIDVCNLKKDPHYKKIKCLYKNSFPFLERLPLFIVYRNIKNKCFTFTKYIDELNNDLLGFSLIVKDSGINYISFLAVDNTKRNMGIGTNIINYLLKRYTNSPLVLCSEYYDKDVPSSDIRVRRVNFYLRNGFSMLPYITKVFGVKFFTLGNMTNIDLSCYLDVFKKIFGKLLFFLMHKNYHIERCDKNLKIDK